MDIMTKYNDDLKKIEEEIDKIAKSNLPIDSKIFLTRLCQEKMFEIRDMISKINEDLNGYNNYLPPKK